MNELDKEKREWIIHNKDEFKKILLDAGAEKVLKDYKIKSILGSGAIGTAFNLEPPHENYVLKFQATQGKFGTDREAIEQWTHVLNDATRHLAEIRMNRSVQAALSGKNIEQL